MVEINFMNSGSDIVFIGALIAAVIASVHLRRRPILFASAVLLLPMFPGLYKFFTAPRLPNEERTASMADKSPPVPEQYNRRLQSVERLELGEVPIASKECALERYDKGEMSTVEGIDQPFSRQRKGHALAEEMSGKHKGEAGGGESKDQPLNPSNCLISGAEVERKLNTQRFFVVIGLTYIVVWIGALTGILVGRIVTRRFTNSSAQT